LPHCLLRSVLLIALPLSGAGALAQDGKPQQPVGEVLDRAGKIVVQPAHDVGVARTEIPPVLLKAAEDPYSVEKLGTCRELTEAIKELSNVLGPDFTTARQRRENRAGRIAEAGGRIEGVEALEEEDEEFEVEETEGETGETENKK